MENVKNAKRLQRRATETTTTPSYRSVNAAFNWVNELKSDKYTPTLVLYQQRITAIAAIELAQDRQVVDARQVCVLLSCFSCGLSFPYSRSLVPSSRSFLTVAFFFLSLLLDRTERALAPGTRLLPDREAIDRARARWLPPKGRPNGPTWRDRISIFHRARLRITCPCAPHANEPFAYLDEFVPDDWKIICRVTCGYCEEHSFSYWLGLLAKYKQGRRETLRLIYHFEHSLRRLEIVSRLRVKTKVHKRYDWQLSLIGINFFSSHSILIFISAYRNIAISYVLYNYISSKSMIL